MQIRHWLFVSFTPAAAVALACSSESAPAPASRGQVTSAESVAQRARAASLRDLDPLARPDRPATRASLATAASATSPDGGTSPQPPARCRQANRPVPAWYRQLVSLFESDLANTSAGAAIAILEKGRLAFVHAGGKKGPNSAEPVCPSSLFRIGSVTKAMTATAYLHLVDEGKVGDAAKLIDIAPDVTLPAGPSFSKLTMAEVLTMESGIVDLVNFVGPSDNGYLSRYLTGPDFKQSVFFMDPPRSFFDYSNTNYMLAGLAVERIGAVPYIDAVKRSVTAPLGMDRTMFLPREVLADGDYTNGLSSHDDGTPWDVTPDAYDDAAIRPAGSAFSSVIDFARFVEFIYQGNPSVLSRRLWTAMRAPLVSTRTFGDLAYYGLGLQVSTGTDIVPAGGDIASGTYYPGKRIHHGGGIPGWSTDWELFPETGFGVIIFQNSDSFGFSKTYEYAVQHLAGLTAGTLPSNLAVDPSRFPQYAGGYFDPNQVGRVTVTDDNGTLSIAMPDVDALGIPYDHTLVPYVRDNFSFMFAGGLQLVTFIPDATGKYRWFRALQDFVAERVSSAERAPNPSR